MQGGHVRGELRAREDADAPLVEGAEDEAQQVVRLEEAEGADAAAELAVGQRRGAVRVDEREDAVRERRAAHTEPAEELAHVDLARGVRVDALELRVQRLAASDGEEGVGVGGQRRWGSEAAKVGRARGAARAGTLSSAVVNFASWHARCSCGQESGSGGRLPIGGDWLRRFGQRPISEQKQLDRKNKLAYRWTRREMAASCTKCARLTEGALAQHCAATGHDGKPYSCGVCGRAFRSKQGRKHHCAATGHQGSALRPQQGEVLARQGEACARRNAAGNERKRRQRHTAAVMKKWSDATPLLVAADCGRAADVSQLLAAGAPVEWGGEDAGMIDWTPLLSAAAEGHDGVVEQLLEAGANVDHEDCDGRTALYRAAEAGHDAAAKQLLVAGAAVVDGDTLDAAVLYGKVAVVALLLDAGVDVNEVIDGWPPLFRAIRSGTHRLRSRADHEAVVGQLLAAGADPNWANSKGETAVSAAEAHGLGAIVQMVRDCIGGESAVPCAEGGGGASGGSEPQAGAL